MIKMIAVNFGDNDFYCTFEALLNTIRRAIIENNTFTQEQVKTLLREGVLFHYKAFQNRFQYRCEEEDFSHTERYLVSGLADSQIFFDDDCHKFLNGEWYNSEVFIIDIESGQFYCV